MMATSMGPNFTGHPAGMGHPGVAGHPMGPGMPPNSAQGAPGGGMPQQFAGAHMAVGPGGQVNPALMGAMPPGANPHAHALQHLSPAQQQMFQQQQQQQQQQHQQQPQNQYNNPSAVAAMRQQHMLQHQQQQARQAFMAQQAIQAKMQAGVNGMPLGMPLNQLNPQQIQQLRQAGRIGPGQHPGAQALMAHQLALQQQQQQQQQQHQQQQHHQQQQQQHHQHQQQHHQQQQLQQQQAAQNQQMSGNPQGQGQPMGMNAQGMANVQQQQQAQMGALGQNPMVQPQQVQPGQGQHQAGQQQQQGQQQQPGQQAQQPPQHGSQAGTPAPSGQQTPAQTPAPPTPSQTTQQVGPNAQQQHQPQSQGPQQQQHQPPPPHQQQQQQQHQQAGGPGPQQMNAAAAAAAAQQIAMSNSLFQQQRREGMKGQCLLKLMQFSEHLSGFPGNKARDDLSYWNGFVMRFFSTNGIFRHSLHITDNEESMDKQYEIAYPAIARYFHTHFGSGVKSMQLIMDKGLTDRPLPGDFHCIENQRASLVYWFESGSHLVSTGTLRVQFDSEQKIELFEFLTTGHEEYISRKQVIDAAKPAHMWLKEWHKVNSQDGKTSPEMSKKSKAKQLKSPQTQPPEVLVDLPDSAVNSKGVTAAVHQFLEIVEVMGQMNPLFGFCHGNPGVGPYAALEQYVSTYINGAPQSMNGQQGPQGAPRTPGYSQFPMGASPAAAHMNLPGSPHVGSPATGQMQAPGMQLQPSQQGTSSSGPSANTSPASNKRRRPSGVKTEDDGSGAGTPASVQVNGVQGRGKPATPRMPKRVKGNPS